MSSKLRSAASGLVKKSPALYSWINRRRYTRLHVPTVAQPFDVIGTYFGGWPVLRGTLSADSLIYSAGVGFDVSFETGLIEQYNCRIVALDPTPRSIEWLAQQNMPPQNFSFLAMGLAGSDGAIAFSEATGDDSCFSKPQGDAANDSPEFEVARFSTIVERRRDRVPDVLKMDIEGFEYEVIDDIVKGNYLPQQLLLEFHHGLYGIPEAQTLASVDALLTIGYEIFYVSDTGREYGFMLPSLEG